jgi:hypothetical protein
MKKYLSVVAFLFIALFSTRCAEKTYTVAADRAVDREVEAGKYDTYAWASHVQDETNSSFFLNDLIFKNMVKSAVAYELDAKGYNLVEGDNADLIVNFRVFEEPVEITGMTGLGTDFWGPTELYEYDDRQTYQLQEGSIIVQLADRNTGKVVWQGYASGLTDGNVFDKDKDKVATAVSKIFERYPFESIADTDTNK